MLALHFTIYVSKLYAFIHGQRSAYTAQTSTFSVIFFFFLNLLCFALLAHSLYINSV